MSFERVFLNDMQKQGFGSVRYLACYKERPHASKSALESNSNSIGIKLYESKRMDYDSWKNERYLLAEGISYDMLLTLYEVNTSRLAAIRSFGRKGLEEKEISNAIREIASGKPNIEARIIGIQNGEEFDYLKGVVDALVSGKAKIVEVDLFGGDIRNVAIDIKTGMSYNLLIHDKNYMMGELSNKMSREDFERSLMNAEKKD